MRFKSKREIYEALLSGKKIRAFDFKNGAYVHLDKCGNLVDELGLFQDFNFTMPDAWRVYEEPKPALYLWAWEDEDGEWKQSLNYYPDEKAFRQEWDAKQCIRLDWSRIEVE